MTSASMPNPLEWRSTFRHSSVGATLRQVSMSVSQASNKKLADSARPLFPRTNQKGYGRVPTVRASAVDDPRLALEDRLQQVGKSGVVLEVGVEDGEEIAARLGDAALQRCALPLVAGLPDEPDGPSPPGP